MYIHNQNWRWVSQLLIFNPASYWFDGCDVNDSQTILPLWPEFTILGCSATRLHITTCMMILSHESMFRLRSWFLYILLGCWKNQRYEIQDVHQLGYQLFFIFLIVSHSFPAWPLTWMMSLNSMWIPPWWRHKMMLKEILRSRKIRDGKIISGYAQYLSACRISAFM